MHDQASLDSADWQRPCVSPNRRHGHGGCGGYDNAGRQPSKHNSRPGYSSGSGNIRDRAAGFAVDDPAANHADGNHGAASGADFCDYPAGHPDHDYSAAEQSDKHDHAAEYANWGANRNQPRFDHRRNDWSCYRNGFNSRDDDQQLPAVQFCDHCREWNRDCA